MGLLDPDQAGQAQFFSPSKVAAARQRAAEIEERRIERKNKKKKG